jgi:predicted RNA binding protein YcfA (HicA-like mRNA interferase family)
MAQVDKLIEQFRRRPPQADFADVERVLRAYGWQLDRERGSHAAFVKAGEPVLVIPKVNGRQVKAVYIREVLKRLGLED